MPSTFDRDLLSPEYLADPYSYYRALRESEPIAWSERLNAWVLTRYAEVVDALRDPRLVSGQRVKVYAEMLPPATRDEMRPLLDHVGLWIGNLDPPDHTRLRRLVNVVFTPRMVEGLRPDIERTIAELLDELANRSQFDFVQDFAYPLPAIVISQMLGVPRADRERFMSWSDDLTAYAGTGKPDLDIARAASKSTAALVEYLQGLLAKRRAEPAGDLISGLARLEDEGDKLSEQELLSMCGFLLVAGHETTMGLLTNGMLALLKSPEQLERLRNEPDLTNSAVEELLRYDSPIQHQTRVAGEDLELGGRQIEKGQRVVPLLGAANRDPDQFFDPDKLDLARSPNRHVAFGHGIHFCVGAPLARLEAQIAFPAILHRFPKMQLADEPLVYRRHTSNRNPIALQIVIRER